MNVSMSICGSAVLLESPHVESVGVVFVPFLLTAPDVQVRYI